MKSIYLSGAISGISIEEMRGWRDEIIEFVSNFSKWKCFNPCDHLLQFRSVIPDAKSVGYDLDMLRHSRIMVVNMQFNPISVGTMIEIGVAYENKIPVVVVNPDHISLHPWVEAIASHICDSIEDAQMCLADHYLNEE